MPGTILTTHSVQVFYYTAGSYTLAIPEGVSIMTAWVQAAGGSGKGRSGVDGSAGGGGGFSYIVREVLSSEWGNNLSIAVGAGSASNNGGNSTLSGTVGGGSISLTANGGVKGTTLADGAGGTASGGDTNLSGEDGSGFVVGPPGEEEPGTPGKSGGIYNAAAGSPFIGVSDVSFFGPGEGGFASSVDIAGWDGYVTVEFS
jgi:hypothetical protein